MLHPINQLSQIQELSQLRAVTDDPNPWLLIAAGVVVVVLLLILLWPRVHGGGSTRNRGDALAGADVSLAQQRSVERDMQTLMSELSEMARKIGAQLDAKSARLEALIRAADERAGRLETQLRAEPAPQRRDGDQPTDDPREAASFTTSPPSIEIPPPSSDADGDRRHAQIYALADEGLSPVQIAERLDLPEGEVELIIALRPRGRATI